MLKYTILLFIRNIRRQKLFSTINLLGLTAGIVSTLLIYLYVQHELTYDRFHVGAENIYRINQTFIWGEHDDNQFASLGPGVAYAIKTDIPEVKEVTRIQPPGNFLVSYEEDKNDVRSFDEPNILAVDSNFFSVFTFPLVKGNVNTALQKPQSIILTQSTARKYFGADDALGKFLRLGEGEESMLFEITGVAKDVPDNSYIKFDMLISMNSFPRIINSNDLWLWTTFETFVVLDEHASAETLAAKLEPLPRKYAGPTLEKNLYQTFDEYIKSGKKWELFVQPLTDIRLHSSNIYNRLNEVGNVKIVYVLIGVEVFIILLSCINFMNLSTAQYTRRIKESGLRKVLGSQKYHLAVHFFSEAFMFCCLAAVIGFGLTQLFIPLFNTATGQHLELNLVQNPSIMLVLLLLIVVMSILSGSYPAIFLGSVSPVEALKGKFRTGSKGKLLRNSLVTFQFFISMVLIVSTLVVFQQLKFLAQKDIGFNRENLMVIKHVEWVNDKETMLHELENMPNVERASWCTSVPPDLYDGDQFKAQGSEKIVPLNYAKADEKYASTLGLHLKSGRDFSKEIPADKNRVILNETAVQAFGWDINQNVIGKLIDYPGRGTYEVIGVVGDFNYWALQSPIQPMAIFHNESSVFSVNRQFMVLRVTPGNTEKYKTMVADVQKKWKHFAGDHPFQYSFVDESFDKTFQSEQKFGLVLIVFATLAIMIACFGLLGMIIFTLEQRAKEIGIRKVVGASAGGIWVLIVKEYTYLVVIAIAASIPFCIWFLNNWLEDFNYRITLSPTAFVIAGVGILVTALSVTSYHVLKAAFTNPVDILKDE